MAGVLERLLTAEEYAALADDDRPTELVRGKIVPVNPPKFRHGRACWKAAWIWGGHVEEHDLGYAVCNDTGIITERDPDTVRGADFAYFSYERVAKGAMPDGYAPVAPDLVFEVLSPDDRWSRALAKVAEYLGAGVRVVCVLDPQAKTARVFRGWPGQRVGHGRRTGVPRSLWGVSRAAPADVRLSAHGVVRGSDGPAAERVILVRPAT